MARADLVTSLVRAGIRGDQAIFKKTVEALIAEERSKQHHILADRLTEYLKDNGYAKTVISGQLDLQAKNLLHEVSPIRKIEDLFLQDSILSACKELVEEQQRGELLRSYNLEPRHRILLAGPPGNGKTSLAEAVAESMMVPFYVVRYEGVIGSYLGETAVRLNRLFDYVRSRHCVLFFDEFDTLGKERGDLHETGEIKRVVSSLLLQIDGLPSYVVVITASNHPELLDRAVWRRFQLRLFLPPPTKKQIEQWFLSAENRIGKPLGYSPRTFSEKLKGLSFAELEEFCADIQRRIVLDVPSANPKQIVGDRLKQWETRFKVSETSGVNEK